MLPTESMLRIPALLLPKAMQPVRTVQLMLRTMLLSSAEILWIPAI